VPLQDEPNAQAPLPERSILACQRILFAVCCKALPSMGYCQGLNYMACILYYLTGNDESLSFELMTSMITSLKL